MSAPHNFLMPSERICLKRTRESLIESLDVTSVLPKLRASNMLSAEDEQHILADPRRRERAVRFIDVLQRKNSATFKTFCNELEEQSPHLYLILAEWDKEQPTGAGQQLPSVAVNDEWSAISRCRRYILSQVDGGNVVPLLPSNVLTSSQRAQIQQDPTRESRTETLLDILEAKAHDAQQAFIDAVGELYPHVYLELTGKGDDDDGW